MTQSQPEFSGYGYQTSWQRGYGESISDSLDWNPEDENCEQYRIWYVQLGGGRQNQEHKLEPVQSLVILNGGAASYPVVP